MKISNKFSPGYIDQVFSIWYSRGKPPATKLFDLIPEDALIIEKPHTVILRNWMKTEELMAKTEDWDFVTEKALREKSTAAKIEMLERHAEVGKEMQQTSLDWIRDHKEELTAGTAVRMLVEGIRVEQGAVGIPDAIRRMQEIDDEKLLEEVAQLIADSESEIDAYN